MRHCQPVFDPQRLFLSRRGNARRQQEKKHAGDARAWNS
jgi:hypothetical protein